MPRFHRVGIPIIALCALFVLHYIFSPSAHDNHTLEDPAEPLPNRHKLHGSHKHPSLSVIDDVDIDRRGLTAFNPGNSEHPIERLIERGKQLAKDVEDKISETKTVEDAVRDYELAFGMKAPKGFDKWYGFTQSFHTPPLPSLLPFAHEPFLSFLALPSSVLRERVDDIVENHWSMFSLTFVPDGQGDIGTACKPDEAWEPEDWLERGKGRVIVKGQAAWGWRCNNTLSLLLPVLPLLPSELFKMSPPLEIAFSTDDGPRGMIHHDVKQRGEALGKSGKLWPPSQLDKAQRAMGWTYGWQWACPPDSPMKIQNTDKVLNEFTQDPESVAHPSHTQNEKSFIADFDRSADFCYNADLASYHHVLLVDSNRAALNLVPTVAMCRTAYNSDILGVPLDGVFERVQYIPWEQKTYNKAFWRGSATGLFHNKNNPWRSSQRERLHFLSHNTSDAPLDILINRPQGIKVEEWDRDLVNKAWLDVGLSGQPVQCTQEDGSCDEMAKEIEFMGRVEKSDAAKYKFVIDVDGNGWSSRFRRLLAGNNVVLKSTIYTEWYHEILIPWYHYVPLKLDYTDLYDILAFFNGSPDGSTNGRDDLAREIAENGHQFAEERWRMEDMQSFMFLLILEYWRLMSDDRATAVYSG